jgi:23S rRNA (cytidine1920-2'-O)/16S rRNA (cytidine1409-2'-O)-methyltransferase
MSERIDKIMVDAGLVKTRSQARMLIKQGDVSYNKKPVKKAGLIVDDPNLIEIKQGQLYVSRGAYKLVKAIEEFHLDFKDKLVVDCGASTGGFTQVSLVNGAKKVYAIDVGHDQLNPMLREDDRVINMEGINLKYPLELPEKVDYCVCDISFISITKVFLTISSFLKEGGKAIILIKPQFEAEKERIARGGIVKEEFQEEIVNEVRAWFVENDFQIINICESPITGKTGNIEYLALVEKR